jgi:hypothetical protein
LLSPHDCGRAATQRDAVVLATHLLARRRLVGASAAPYGDRVDVTSAVQPAPASGRPAGLPRRAREFAAAWLAYGRQLVPVLAPVQRWHRLRGRTVVACVGDSHLEPMWLVQQRKLLPRTRLAVLPVGGATASGAQNPNSKTNAFKRWLPFLRRLNPEVLTVSCLGEVDVGFLIFARPDAADALATTLQRYQEFLDLQVRSRGGPLVVLGVIPPIIEDYSSWAGPRGQKRDVDATWAERAEMTDQFNRAMAAWCAEFGATFVDLAAQVTDADGRVRAQLRHPDTEDHHLDPDLTAELFATALRAAGCS